MRFLQAKGIEISICKATVTSSVEEMLEGKKHEPPLVPWHLFPYRVARRKPGGKIPLLRYFLLEIIRESFLPLVPGDKSVFSFYLSKSGYFSTHSPRMFGSRYSFVETFSISSIYRFVPSNKPKWRRDSRAISILRMYTRRDRIESGCKEGIHEPREPCNDYYVETRWNSWKEISRMNI